VASFKNKAAQAKARREIQKRVSEIQARSTENLDYAFDKLIHEQPDLYFKMEEGLEEVRLTVVLIGEGLEDASGLAELERLERRLDFVEDRFEELESELFSRPRRRRKRRPSLADFFRAAAGGGGSGEAGDPQGEVRTSAEAYAILGLEDDSSLTVVTRAFRQKLKELHPDARDGDRSAEPQLRKLIAAYQYLKTIYNWGEDTPSASP
jgi:hypothetical protein